MLYLKNGFSHKTILFYPQLPLWETEIFKIIKSLDYNITNNPHQKFDMVFNWEDITFRNEYPLLKELSKRYPIINYNCHDISKKRVEAVFQEIFGYSSFVDPTTHQGVCVQKNDLNAKHDGKIIQCPIKHIEPEYIYQKLLSFETADKLVADYRIPIFGSIIPFLVIRYKQPDTRFTKVVRVSVVDPTDLLSKEELENIRLFCQKIGLQYGELDMIRNKEDGRLYILDANNTPWSPPTSVELSKEQRQLMLRKGVEAFRHSFLTSLS
ncbi:hypothetical protein GXP67_23760 [Rhodocytophaga rosea]|uniref:ATP-grasp domain-containing protein n=1 Tax=Rhodocytophaga rosea TaxID=2704465 RepID=A0A6C0GN16_9BACT|nr:hypothetical protein [Rhodocytophaga rosea]QHT69441.1 hypothetical protein GXP67_23760 [Rhodocytophaga rosea]